MNIFSTALDLLQFAPLLGKWLWGDDGEKVSFEVLEMAKKITGEKEGDDIIKYLSSHPEQLLEFQKQLLHLYERLESSGLQDRVNARNRDLAFAQLGRKNWRADIMVVCAALGLSLCLLSLAFFKGSLPGEAVGIISTVSGIFGSCLKDAYAFEFGSSRGSKEKDYRATAAAIDREFKKFI